MKWRAFEGTHNEDVVIALLFCCLFVFVPSHQGSTPLACLPSIPITLPGNYTYDCQTTGLISGANIYIQSVGVVVVETWVPFSQIKVEGGAAVTIIISGSPPTNATSVSAGIIEVTSAAVLGLTVVVNTTFSLSSVNQVQHVVTLLYAPIQYLALQVTRNGYLSLIGLQDFFLFSAATAISAPPISINVESGTMFVDGGNSSSIRTSFIYCSSNCVLKDLDVNVYSANITLTRGASLLTKIRCDALTMSTRVSGNSAVALINGSAWAYIAVTNAVAYDVSLSGMDVSIANSSLAVMLGCFWLYIDTTASPLAAVSVSAISLVVQQSQLSLQSKWMIILSSATVFVGDFTVNATQSSLTALSAMLQCRGGSFVNAARVSIILVNSSVSVVGYALLILTALESGNIVVGTFAAQFVQSSLAITSGELLGLGTSGNVTGIDISTDRSSISLVRARLFSVSGSTSFTSNVSFRSMSSQHLLTLGSAYLRYDNATVVNITTNIDGGSFIASDLSSFLRIGGVSNVSLTRAAWTMTLLNITLRSASNVMLVYGDNATVSDIVVSLHSSSLVFDSSDFIVVQALNLMRGVVTAKYLSIVLAGLLTAQFASSASCLTALSPMVIEVDTISLVIASSRVSVLQSSDLLHFELLPTSNNPGGKVTVNGSLIAIMTQTNFTGRNASLMRGVAVRNSYSVTATCVFTNSSVRVLDSSLSLIGAIGIVNTAATSLLDGVNVTLTNSVVLLQAGSYFITNFAKNSSSSTVEIRYLMVAVSQCSVLIQGTSTAMVNSDSLSSPNVNLWHQYFTIIVYNTTLTLTSGGVLVRGWASLRGTMAVFSMNITNSSVLIMFGSFLVVLSANSTTSGVTESITGMSMNLLYSSLIVNASSSVFLCKPQSTVSLTNTTSMIDSLYVLLKESSIRLNDLAFFAYAFGYASVISKFQFYAVRSSVVLNNQSRAVFATFSSVKSATVSSTQIAFLSTDVQITNDCSVVHSQVTSFAHNITFSLGTLVLGAQLASGWLCTTSSNAPTYQVNVTLNRVAVALTVPFSIPPMVAYSTLSCVVWLHCSDIRNGSTTPRKWVTKGMLLAGVGSNFSVIDTSRGDCYVSHTVSGSHELTASKTSSAYERSRVRRTASRSYTSLSAYGRTYTAPHDSTESFSGDRAKDVTHSADGHVTQSISISNSLLSPPLRISLKRPAVVTLTQHSNTESISTSTCSSATIDHTIVSHTVGFNSTDVDPKAPMPALASATQAIANTGTFVGAATGDLSSANTMAMLAILYCGQENRESVITGLTAFLISPFFSFGPVAMAFGNLGLMLAFFGLHCLSVQAVAIRRKTTFAATIGGKLRFPALGLVFAEFYLPGVVFGMVQSFRKRTTQGIALSVIIAVIVPAIVVGRQLLLEYYVIPRTTWELYKDVPQDRIDSMFYPIGRWAPKRVRNSFGPLMNQMKRRFVRWSVVNVCVSLIITAASSAGSSNEKIFCQSALILIACLSFLLSAATAATRPFRRPMDRYIIPLYFACFGAVAAMKAAAVSDEVTGTLQLIQSFLVLWKSAWSIWISIRESHWERDTKEMTLGTVVSALWFGGGGTGTVTEQSVTLVRPAVNEAEELANDVEELAEASTPAVTEMQPLVASEPLHKEQEVPLPATLDAPFDAQWLQETDRISQLDVHDGGGGLFGVENYYCITKKEEEIVV